MRTTTVIRESFRICYSGVSEETKNTSILRHLEKTQSVLEAFGTAHGVSIDNLISQSEGDQRVTVRSWPDLATAQAWVDLVLSGATTEGLDYPVTIISAQVDPE